VYQNGCVVIVTHTLCCDLIPFGMVGKELVFDVDEYWQRHEFLWIFHPKILSFFFLLYLLTLTVSF
jgi:hypothetical protein